MSLRSEVVRIFNELLAGAKKISELPDATTPLAGTEQLEINQGGVSKKVAVSNVGGGGGSQDLQSVLDEGSTANLGANLQIDINGNGFQVFGATANAQITNDLIDLGVGTNAARLVLDRTAGTARIVADAIDRFYANTVNNDYSAESTGVHRFLVPGDGATIRLMEESGSGTSYVALKAPTNVTTSQTYTFPAAGPSVNDSALVSTTGGALSFVPIIGVQDLFISASAMWPRTTGGCADLAKTEIATSLFNIQSLDFDQTTQEFCQFQIVLPRKWNNGTVTAVFYWTAAAGSGDVQWGISGGAYSNDDALTVAFGTAITVDDTLLATDDLHITAATAAITLAGTPADADFLAFQISRNPASDTLTGDAKLLGVSIRLTISTGIDA